MKSTWVAHSTANETCTHVYRQRLFCVWCLHKDSENVPDSRNREHHCWQQFVYISCPSTPLFNKREETRWRQDLCRRRHRQCLNQMRRRRRRHTTWTINQRTHRQLNTNNNNTLCSSSNNPLYSIVLRRWDAVNSMMRYRNWTLGRNLTYVSIYEYIFSCFSICLCANI